MPITVVAPAAPSSAERVSASVIEVRENWSDDWQYMPELEMRRCVAASAGHDLPVLEFRRTYGRAKSPHDSTIPAAGSAREPIDLDDYWVRMRLVGEHGLSTEWVGRVNAESRSIHGSASYRSGVQTWTAYGPGQILRKIHVHESYWAQWDSEQKLGWVPGMNSRDANNTIVGNRSNLKSPDEGGTYLYGGTGLWNRYDYAEYILKRFVDESEDGGPEWWLGGQAYELEHLTDTISFSANETVADILRRLISTRQGFDYAIIPGNGGFEIFVYALTAEEWQYGSVTLPRNPMRFDVRRKDEKHLISTRVVRTAEQKHGKIVVLGRRIVVCCSLHGLKSPQGEADNHATLVGKWAEDLETTTSPPYGYREGTGTVDDDADDHDKARLADRFHPVYQFFGAPDGWDWQEGFARVELDENGEVIPASSGNYQDKVRRTLTRLPLREGVDYGTNPPTDNDNPADYEPEFRNVDAWLYVKNEDGDGNGGTYVSLDVLGITVSASGADWGIVVNPSPNHLLALNHWEGAADTNQEPTYDYETLVATIAIETDQRFAMTYEVPDAKPSDGTLVVSVPDAELWYLAVDTIVGIDEFGELIKSPVDPDTGLGTILRNDADRMALAMAGAISRYRDARARAELIFRGLLPRGYWIGQILGVLDEGGDTHEIQAPVTSVEWIVTDTDDGLSTIIRTGFAR